MRKVQSLYTTTPFVTFPPVLRQTIRYHISGFSNGSHISQLMESIDE
jgi:hypothetical protein